MQETAEQLKRLGAIGEHVVSIFPRLQREVTVPHPNVMHVTRSEADLLRIILLDPGSTITQVAKTAGQARSNTSARIARLVESGMIEKRSEERDGREVRLYATRRARENFAGFRDVWGSVLAEVSSASPADLEIAERVLSEIADQLAVWKKVVGE